MNAVTTQAVTGDLITTGGALLGVVVGGLLTVLVEERRQKRKDKALLRAATRLLSAELTDTAVAFENLADNGSIDRTKLGEVVPSWEGYREFLAGQLQDHAWEGVARVVTSARQVRSRLLAGMQEATVVQPASDPERQLARNQLEDIHALVASLAGRLTRFADNCPERELHRVHAPRPW